MIPDQNSDEPRHARILHKVNAAEDMVKDLRQHPESPALSFKTVAYPIESARNIAQNYYTEAQKLPEDKTSCPGHRRSLLDDLAEATNRLKIAQENFTEDLETATEAAAAEGRTLSRFFLNAAKNCGMAITDAAKEINNAVLEGRSLIGSQQSQNNIISDIRARKPAHEKPATKPDWFKGIISTPSPELR